MQQFNYELALAQSQHFCFMGGCAGARSLDSDIPLAKASEENSALRSGSNHFVMIHLQRGVGCM